jgi:hypothetical protein
MGQEVFVGTAEGLHVLGDERRVRVAGHDVRSLARGETGWWAIIDSGAIWQSNAADWWTPVASMEELQANCLLPAKNGPFIGTSGAHIQALRGEALSPVDSFEETEGRETWYTPWGGPPDVRSMSIDPSGVIFANVHVGGVVRSTDGGMSWQPTIDIHSDVHQVLFNAGSGLLLAATARGLAVSADAGDSWRFETGGLHGDYLRAVAVSGETVLVSASTGPSTDRAAVYRKSLGEEAPFQRCRQGLPEWFSDNIDTFCVAASGSAIALGASEGSVYLSTDEGRSWSVLADDLPRVRCVAV